MLFAIRWASRARTIFHADRACVGQEFLVIDRDHEINLAIQTALKEGHSEVRAARNDREYQFDISQITAECLDLPVLLVDATQEGG